MKNGWMMTFLLLICCSSIHAQYVWQVQAAPILCKTSIIDRQYSSTSFSGVIPGGALGLSLVHGRAAHQLDLLYTSGNLHTDTHPAYDAKQQRFCADYTYLYAIRAPGSSPLTLDLGGAANFFYATRTFSAFINDNNPFDLAASLGAAARLGLSFGDRLAGLSLSDRVSVPLISYLSQNGADHRVAGPDGFLRLTNFLSLDKSLTERQQLSLTYSWDYYHIKGLRETREADHRLALNYRLIL